MSIQEVIESSHTILKNLTNYPDEILAPLAHAKQIQVMQTVGELSEQALDIYDEASLLQVTKALHDLAADIPGMLHVNGHPRHLFNNFNSIQSENGKGYFVQEQKFKLQKYLHESYIALKQATAPNYPPNLARPIKTITPWEWFGAFKHDPTWGLMFDEIERQRDMQLVGEDE